MLDVARAMEAEANRASPEERARRLVLTADLLERLWRRDRISEDRKQALRLLADASSVEAPAACDAEVSRGLLEGEAEHEPEHAYVAAHLVKFRAEAQHARFERDCLRRAETVALSLQAFKPLPEALREAERRVTEGRPAPTASVASKPAAPPLASTEPAEDGSLRIIEPAQGVGDDLGPARITRIERYGAPDSARIVIYTSRPARFQVGKLAPTTPREGYRLFVDIENASYDGNREFEMDGVVKRLRVGDHEPNTRVVLDLSEDVRRKVFYLPEPFRLVVDVARTTLVLSSEEESGPRKIRRVVLDPGHGGHDPGAVGPSGLREKDVTLDVAHRAAPLIARELGIATLLTRDDDGFVALDERTARANAFQADLFISIHCNASEDTGAQGVMTFVLDASRDLQAVHIAARENAASPAAAAELAQVMSYWQDRDNVQQSTHFASLLQRASLASLVPHYPATLDLGVRRAGFYVLAGAQMPACLFELSFISHPSSESSLGTADYRQRVADSIVNAVRAYREGL